MAEMRQSLLDLKLGSREEKVNFKAGGKEYTAYLFTQVRSVQMPCSYCGSGNNVEELRVVVERLENECGEIARKNWGGTVSVLCRKLLNGKRACHAHGRRLIKEFDAASDALLRE